MATGGNVGPGRGRSVAMGCSVGLVATGCKVESTTGMGVGPTTGGNVGSDWGKVGAGVGIPGLPGAVVD